MDFFVNKKLQHNSNKKDILFNCFIFEIII